MIYQKKSFDNPLFLLQSINAPISTSETCSSLCPFSSRFGFRIFCPHFKKAGIHDCLYRPSNPSTGALSKKIPMLLTELTKRFLRLVQRRKMFPNGKKRQKKTPSERIFHEVISYGYGVHDHSELRNPIPHLH